MMGHPPKSGISTPWVQFIIIETLLFAFVAITTRAADYPYGGGLMLLGFLITVGPFAAKRQPTTALGITMDVEARYAERQRIERAGQRHIILLNPFVLAGIALTVLA